MSKKMSKIALASFVAAAAIPVAVVGAETPTDVEKVVLIKDGKNISLPKNSYVVALLRGQVSANDLGYVEVAGKFFTINQYATAVLRTGSVEKAVASLIENTTPTEGLVVAEGSIKDGQLVTDQTPSELTVTSVSAINATTIKVTFENAVDSLDKADVTVTNKETSEKQYVKAVTLSEDKKSATIELYDTLVTKNTYNVTAKTSSKEFDYVVGKVVKIEAETAQLVKADTATAIKYKVLDENGLDVTSSTTVAFASDKTVTADGEVTLANGTSAFVYITYTDTDGKEVKSERITVTAEAPKAVSLVDYTVSATPVTKAAFEATDFKAVTSLKLGQTGTVYALVKDQFGDTRVATGVEFESLNKAVALVDRATGAITTLTKGEADVRIKVGDISVVRPIEVKEEAKVSSLSLENTAISISEAVPAGQTVKVTVKDQYGDAVKKAGEKVKATVKTGKDIIGAIGTDGVVELTTDAKGVVELPVTPIPTKSGTATIEFAIGDVKTTLTVNVIKAGAVANYVVEGFEKELDQNGANDVSNKLPKTATLKIFAKDANGVATGEALTAGVIYEVKQGTTVVIPETAGTAGALTLDATNLDAGKEYTVTAKVGTLEVFKDTFTVKDTSPQPTVEQKKSSLELTDAKINFADVFTVTFDGNVTTDYTVDAIKVTSDNASVATDIKVTDPASKELVFTAGEGNATLIVDTVTLKIDGKNHEVKLNNAPVNIKVSGVVKKVADKVETDLTAKLATVGSPTTYTAAFKDDTITVATPSTGSATTVNDAITDIFKALPAGLTTIAGKDVSSLTGKPDADILAKAKEILGVDFTGKKLEDLKGQSFELPATLIDGVTTVQKDYTIKF